MSATPVPRLQKLANGRWEFLVDDEPYMILGAELQNSSMSSARYMKDVWQSLVNIGINTVLGAVSWENVEPEEDQFQFDELDEIINQARTFGLRLILLWFGSFKNGASSYIPTWVKTKSKRFPRMYCNNADGSLQNMGVLSVFHEECAKADAKAFGRLLQHVKDTDKDHTIIMVQVENEPGLYGFARDHSPEATELFNAKVPNQLVEFIDVNWDNLHSSFKEKHPGFKDAVGQVRKNLLNGNWENYFGKTVWTEGLFMAYYFALYVEKVAHSGRQVYDIPLFSNAWLAHPDIGEASGGGKPGEYPSGGPAITVLDIWQRFAPSLDFIAPDIYYSQYNDFCAQYSHGGQPLFIPEQRRDHVGARQAWIAIGSHHALGISPFGIDTLTAEEAAFTPHYKLLGSVYKHILKARRENLQSAGVCFHDAKDKGNPSPPLELSFASYDLTVTRASDGKEEAPGYGIIIELEPSSFLLIGKGFKVEWKHKSLGYTAILKFEEKSIVDAKTQELRTERTLNGDESSSGRWANMPNDDPDHGDCPVAIWIPARTGIAQVSVFSLGNDH